MFQATLTCETKETAYPCKDSENLYGGGSTTAGVSTTQSNEGFSIEIDNELPVESSTEADLEKATVPTTVGLAEVPAELVVTTSSEESKETESGESNETDSTESGSEESQESNVSEVQQPLPDKSEEDKKPDTEGANPEGANPEGASPEGNLCDRPMDNDAMVS